MILVTGAGGLLGANLVRRLVADGHRVRAAIHTERDKAGVEGLPVKILSGDLRDRTFATLAVRGCRQVHHCAAKISTTYRDKASLFEANVLATRNLLDAALEEKVQKMVVTGSISATGHRSGVASTEDDPFDPLDRHLPYAFAKAAVEHECLKAFANGLPVVIAVATAIVGPHDFQPSQLGQTLVKFSKGRLPAYIPGGFPFVSTRDLVEGHLLCIEKGRPGQKYIFETSFTTFDQLMRMFSVATGRPPPLRLSPALMSPVAAMTGWVMRFLRPDTPQMLTPAAIRILSMNRRVDISKARDELGFRPTSVEDAVFEAYDCFVKRGIIASREPRSSASGAGQRP